MLSRRALLAAVPAIAAAAQQGRAQQRFEFFTDSEAADVIAIAERILPADETAGATDAGVVYFIDRALSGYFADQQKLYRESLASLAGISKLPVDAQIAKLTALERTPFFEAIRAHTIMGFLADPRHGGNRNGVGWTAIGFESKHMWQPPFGSYEQAE